VFVGEECREDRKVHGRGGGRGEEQGASHTVAGKTAPHVGAGYY
jgi:hypothetical protein